MTTHDHSTRRRNWPDCRNTRDLGGLPTTDGSRIRSDALIRSDNLDRLTQAYAMYYLPAPGQSRFNSLHGAEAQAPELDARLSGRPDAPHLRRSCSCGPDMASPAKVGLPILDG